MGISWNKIIYLGGDNMPGNTFSYKSSVSGCCRKCGKPLQWKAPSMIGVENPTACMVSAESHIQELQRNVAQNTLFCSDCRARLKDDLILNILLLPFNIIKTIIKLFKR
jgi:hypothetical protein